MGSRNLLYVDFDVDFQIRSPRQRTQYLSGSTGLCGLCGLFPGFWGRGRGEAFSFRLSQRKKWNIWWNIGFEVGLEVRVCKGLGLPGSSLENYCGSDVTGGSNPSLSAKKPR